VARYIVPPAPGERGPLCVLEAKSPDLDPYEAKEQVRSLAVVCQ